MAINLYLAEKYGGGLKPRTPEEWGTAYQWTFWGMMETEDLLLTALRHRYLYPEEQRDPAKADVAEAALQKPLAVLNNALGGRKYLLGNEFTVADLNLAHLFTWARRANIDLSAHPNIDRWLDECYSRPAYLTVNAKREVEVA